MKDYKSRRAYLSHLFTLALGVGIGVATWHWLFEPDPVNISGVLQIDSASHEDLYLNNAIYISSPSAPDGRIYLQFRSNKQLNTAWDANGANVELTGEIKSHILDSGEPVTEIHVQTFEVAR